MKLCINVTIRHITDWQKNISMPDISITHKGNLFVALYKFAVFNTVITTIFVSGYMLVILLLLLFLFIPQCETDTIICDASSTAIILSLFQSYTFICFLTHT